MNELYLNNFDAMRKLTKKAIREATVSTEVSSRNFGRCFNYMCQLAMNKNYECSYIDGKLYRNEGNSTFDTYRTTETKKEFIDAIYELEKEQ